jgi:hypothetical protein
MTRMTFVGKSTTITCPACQQDDLWYHKPLREEHWTLDSVGNCRGKRQIDHPAQWRCSRCGSLLGAERLRGLKVRGELVQLTMAEREKSSTYRVWGNRGGQHV